IIPTQADTVIIAHSGTYTVTATGIANCSSLTVGGATGIQTVLVDVDSTLNVQVNLTVLQGHTFELYGNLVGAPTFVVAGNLSIRAGSEVKLPCAGCVLKVLNSGQLLTGQGFVVPPLISRNVSLARKSGVAPGGPPSGWAMTLGANLYLTVE